MQFTSAQAEFCAKVRVASRTVTVRELLDLLVPGSGEAGVLQRLGKLEEVLQLLLLDVSPSLSVGDLESLVLVSTRHPSGSPERVRGEMRRVEDQQLEFKSTFSCCLKTYRAKAGLERKHYKSDSVEEAALVAIAAMMNTRGGVLLIGVEDDGTPVGLEPDFHALGFSSTDKWLLYVRSKLAEDFVDGRSVSANVSFSFEEVDGFVIARAVVNVRPKIAFLRVRGKPECPPRIYRRLGNQSPEVKADEIEEFLLERQKSRELVLTP